MTEPLRIGRLQWVQVDCADPVQLARFWAAVLGVSVRGELGSGPQYVFLEAAGPDAPRLTFQRVPEKKSVKNRLHLDVAVTDLERATADLVALGAKRVVDGDFAEGDVRWRVLLDPEGNEFCLVEVSDHTT